jgi:hypothetical protein
VQVAEGLDPHVVIWEACHDLQLAAHRAEIATQRAHVHVGALLELGDGGLAHPQGPGQLLL